MKTKEVTSQIESSWIFSNL